jgi:adiponectin receptor
MHHSQATYDLGIKFDYSGILLLMWGSTFPLVCYSFPHRATLQATYLIVTTGLAGSCLLATFHPSIGGPRMGHVRATLFGCFGFGSFLVPIIHGIWVSGLDEQSQKIGLLWVYLTVLLNGTGVFAYALKVSSPA